jgi:hypothetical protein
MTDDHDAGLRRPFKIEGPGYQKTGAILGAWREELPDFRLSLG